MKRICGWCGRVYEAERSTSRYCCSACRCRHHRALNAGRKIKAASAPVPEHARSVGAHEIEETVASIRGAVSSLEAGSRYAGEDGQREMCAYLAAGIASTLEGAGL